MSEDPKWEVRINDRTYTRPKPLNDAARLVDLTLDLSAVQAALVQAQFDKALLEHVNRHLHDEVRTLVRENERLEEELNAVKRK